MGDKCIREDLSNPEELMGNPDYSTLEDMGSAYPVIGEMRLVPFSLKNSVAARGCHGRAAAAAGNPDRRADDSHHSGAPLMRGET